MAMVSRFGFTDVRIVAMNALYEPIREKSDPVRRSSVVLNPIRSDRIADRRTARWIADEIVQYKYDRAHYIRSLLIRRDIRLRILTIYFDVIGVRYARGDVYARGWPGLYGL